jgi:hypothetical protein
VKKTRQIKKLERVCDSIKSERTLGPKSWPPIRQDRHRSLNLIQAARVHDLDSYRRTRVEDIVKRFANGGADADRLNVEFAVLSGSAA